MCPFPMLTFALPHVFFHRLRGTPYEAIDDLRHPPKLLYQQTDQWYKFGHVVIFLEKITGAFFQRVLKRWNLALRGSSSGMSSAIIRL